MRDRRVSGEDMFGARWLRGNISTSRERGQRAYARLGQSVSMWVDIVAREFVLGATWMSGVLRVAEVEFSAR